MVLVARGRPSSLLFASLCTRLLSFSDPRKSVSRSELWSLRSRRMQCTTSTVSQWSSAPLSVTCHQLPNQHSPSVKKVAAACWIKSVEEKNSRQLHSFRSCRQYTTISSNQLSHRHLQTRAAGHTMTEISKHSKEPDSISYLSQADAAAIDELLMGPLGFSVDQLMELAGLSVASAIAEVYGVNEHPRILVICGPGNNGGDGLVAARHLHHFGYKPSIVYPKRTDKPLYHGLVTQLESLSVPFLSEADLPHHLKDDFDIVVDAMFGFSFKGKPRPPFDTLLQRLQVSNDSGAEDAGVPFVVSIDIPSGWHVEEGDTEETGLMPDMLVSLTAPKKCAKHFRGAHHFLGGRFVPPAVVEKYGLQLPAYTGSSMCVRIGKQTSIDVAALRENYVGAVLLEEQAILDPIKQFQVWFEDAVSAGVHEPNAMTLATADAEGNPSARMVLLKGYDERGFVWYTNYGSRKAGELSDNPRAALVFFWDKFNRSVRIEGPVEKVPEEESDNYFHSRPRGSQIGAMVSSQSSVIEGRHVLDQCYKDLVDKYADGAVIPKPDYWGGYRLHPVRIEFWQGRESRLHDRLRYTLTSRGGENKTWSIERLAP
ncbi:pyridoxamine 5'-phosphate oxidase [Marchantia polymorpha subsp. ruderalis]|uniref:NAD(P)H-hydrate epimerase n=5 Tax=Marchantia polymorpha TaxID=3197 RepID=A0AAF6AVG2_MARPO|nr:hypothetical protein MARPO_0107s0030 [Marchantia polymorpha]BBN00433.1 hypothetical protein Mp_1g29150 [Marchantia polymorpha subsp. ruderalis]|eukprot:PTQ31761.1 hypothetical protein MARPO_0107s0030 [Marchantia polymorpha]